jgi:Ulp1 family protease
MCLLQEHDASQCAAANANVNANANATPRQPSHYFGSTFITRLMNLGPGGSRQYDYPGVRRWSKKFDVFAMRRVYMPVNINDTHWTLLVVDMEQKSITFYDSMNGAGSGYLDAAIRWLADEHQDKKKGPLQPPPNQWSLQSRLPHVPQQGNGYDCGVFTSMCADYLTDDLPLQCYGQADMENFRLRIAAACMRGQLGYV